ncbi:Trk system potassium transporter TrkA [Atopococcus tabaci]|uniref:Trk system potassium transporter TrkA n=1 Tax=Atopococcus tabaci TaxID=269774 RepID=UPI000402FD1E|nr:Trk system potassium transporter TrkA [Atopococcus tabaci]
MNIVIAGGGKVGEVLCRELSIEGNDIVLIEKKPDRLERIINKNDITGLAGNGANYDNLVEAGVQNCDIFIAVTPEDEVNIIAAIIAKKLGAAYTIARVRNPEYAGHMNFVRESLGISLMINPEMEAAKDISKVIRFPEALSVEQFVNGKVSIVEVEVKSRGRLADTSLWQFRQEYGDVLVCAVARNNETFIPSGDTVLRENDRIFVTGSRKDLTRFYRKSGYKEEKIRSALIVGGGRVAYYLIRMLSELKIELKVIEINHEKAQRLSEAFPRTVIIEGDGTDQEFLKEERVDQYDSVVSLTGVDEENILISLYAASLGTKKVITKVSRTDLLRILGNVGLQSIITPKRIIASEIIRFVRSLGNTRGSNVEALFRIADNEVEALQFHVKSESKVVGVPLKRLETKQNLLVAYIIRRHKLIFPSGDDSIRAGDRVIVVTTHKTFDDIDDILK